MIPVKDLNPSRSFPLVNAAIVFLCTVVWLYEWSLVKVVVQTPEGPKTAFELFIREWGLVPAELLERPYTLITHMFLHGSWGHFIGNMWFLWVFGDNVEDRLGKVRYLIFYLLSGIGAALTQTVVSLLFGGANVPMVGASGAISGVLAAYMKLFPGARVLALVPVFFFLYFVEVPAVVFYFVVYRADNKRHILPPLLRKGGHRLVRPHRGIFDGLLLGGLL